jgi:hypothetical protein
MTDDLALLVPAAARAADPRSRLQALAERRDRKAVLRALSRQQDGQFATSQARAIGLGPNAVRWLASSGQTVAVRLGVWRWTSAVEVPDPAVTAWLACWPHGTVSHHSAARRHGLDVRTSAPREAEVTIPHARTRVPRGVLVHVTRSLPPCDRHLVGAVPYTSLARTVCDLASRHDPAGTLARVDEAVAAGAAPRWIHDRAASLADGRDGVALVRAATAPGSAAAFRSWLERVAAHVYRAAHLPEPQWNVPVRDARGRIGVVDALWPAYRVISEKEGLRFHTSPRQRRRDAQRFNRLLDAGFTVRRFTWQDVVDRPLDVAATLTRALRAAGADVDLARLPSDIAVPASPF